MGFGSRRLTPSLIWQAILYRLDRRRLKRRFLRPPTVGRADLVAGLRALGIGEGDDVPQLPVAMPVAQMAYSPERVPRLAPRVSE